MISSLTSEIPASRRPHPRLSILVIPNQAGEATGDVLDDLIRQVTNLDAQLVVVGDAAQVDAARLATPSVTERVKLVAAEPGACRNRAIEVGMAAVDGDIVLVRESNRIGGEGWLRPVARLLGRAEAVTGALGAQRVIG